MTKKVYTLSCREAEVAARPAAHHVPHRLQPRHVRLGHLRAQELRNAGSFNASTLLYVVQYKLGHENVVEYRGI